MSSEEKLLIHFPTSQLEEEISRRNTIQNSQWPKQFRINVIHDMDEDEDLLNFLEKHCGFIYDSKEYNNATSNLNLLLEIEIYKNGDISVYSVNDSLLMTVEQQHVPPSEPPDPPPVGHVRKGL